MSLEEIIALWAKEKELYESFTERVQALLDKVIRDQGIMVRVLARTKDDVSLIKKLYKKRNISLKFYFEISDKSAARVICRFKDDTQIVEKCISETFLVLKKEDKIHNLDFNQQGYKSIHFDVKLKEENTPPDIYRKLGHLIGEIQVRTNCEDTWAEIYHDLGYKPSNSVSKEINRQFYCLSGLLEVADNCFSDLNNKIKQSAQLNEDFALRILETNYIKLIRKEYDPEFSLHNLGILLPLLNFSSPQQFEREINSFISKYKDKICQIFEERSKISYIPYLTQPELFLIFYLTVNNPHLLCEKWDHANLAIEDLDELFHWWGLSLREYLPE